MFCLVNNDNIISIKNNNRSRTVPSSNIPMSRSLRVKVAVVFHFPASPSCVSGLFYSKSSSSCSYCLFVSLSASCISSSSPLPVSGVFQESLRKFKACLVIDQLLVLAVIIDSFMLVIVHASGVGLLWWARGVDLVLYVFDKPDFY